MNPRPDFCPGCGAQVFPEEADCPFCGRKLQSSPFLPFLIGLGGAVAAILLAGLVWWVLDGMPPPEGAQPAARQQAAALPPATGLPAAAPTTPAPAQPQLPDAAPASPALGRLAEKPASPADPFAPPPAAPGESPTAALSATGKDMRPFVPAIIPPPALALAPAAPDQAGAPPSAAPSAAQASLAEDQLALPTVRAPAAPVSADSQARRSFAKTTQDRFTQNGLDLTVNASGDEATILTIKFNFPAKTAAELIVAGPFPRQCEQRGFKQVIFLDPSGVSWLYDVSTQKMTQR